MREDEGDPSLVHYAQAIWQEYVYRCACAHSCVYLQLAPGTCSYLLTFSGVSLRAVYEPVSSYILSAHPLVCFLFYLFFL